MAAFQSGLLGADVALRELKRLEDETGLFGSITESVIAAMQGKTYQDVTALRDPLAGLTGGDEVPAVTAGRKTSTRSTILPTGALQARAEAVQ